MNIKQIHTHRAFLFGLLLTAVSLTVLLQDALTASTGVTIFNETQTGALMESSDISSGSGSSAMSGESSSAESESVQNSSDDSAASSASSEEAESSEHSSENSSQESSAQLSSADDSSASAEQIASSFSSSESSSDQSESSSSAYFDSSSSNSSQSSDRLAELSGQEIDKNAALRNPSNIAPSFTIPSHPDIGSAQELKNRIDLFVYDITGESVETEFEVTDEKDSYRVTLESPRTFVPGRYRLVASLSHTRGLTRALQSFFRKTEGESDDADVTLLDESFDWGMIAFNTDKDSYLPGEAVTVHAALVNEKGTPICENLTARIADISTAIENYCAGNEAIVLDGGQTKNPDFSITTLIHNVKQQLFVQSGVPLIRVRRESATQIEPGTSRIMNIRVTAESNMHGVIEETIPAGFIVSDISAQGEARTGKDTTQIEWNVALMANAERTFAYTVTAPKQTPLFAQFGPVEIRMTPDEVVRESIPANSSSENSSDQSSSFAEASAQSSSEASSESAESSSSADNSSANSSEEYVSSGSSDSSESSAASAASASGSFLQSFLDGFSILAAINIYDDSVSFTEDRKWQMIVAEGDLEEARTNRELTLERTAAVFQADASPRFTLVKTELSATDARIVNEDGTLQNEVALQEVLQAVITDEELTQAVVSQVIGAEALNVAMLTLENRANKAELDGVISGSTDAALERAVTRTLEKKQTQEALTEIIRNTDKAADVIEDIIDADLRDRIVQGIAGNGMEPINTEAELALTLEESKELTDTIVETLSESDQTTDIVVENITEPADTQTDDIEIISVKLTGPSGETIENMPFHFEVGSVTLVIDPIRNFTPGLYSLEVIVTNPLTGEQTPMYQQFAWGVLAMNTDKDRYAPGETVHVDFGVLDNRGEIVCNAELTLVVTASGGVARTFSMEDETITKSDTCGNKEAGFIEPDFFANVEFAEAGDYTLTLTAQTPNGIRSISSALTVEENSLFTVKRTGATRLWPFAPSGMKIEVTFSTDVDGMVAETVPENFEIIDMEPNGSLHEFEDGSIGIRWRGAWAAGETATFLYEYDAPDISPQFYLLGPLRILSDYPLTTQ
jgi:hypothetical protein